MKNTIRALTLAVALASSTSAMASVAVPVGQDYTFTFSGNCADCALNAETESYAVTATLKVTNYVLGNALNNSNFVQFDYGGSNLLAPYTMTSVNLESFYGSIGAAPGAYDVAILGDPNYFTSDTDSFWDTGLNNFGKDKGNQGSWVGGAPQGVPEPATWAMMIAGFAMVGAAMRRRAKVSYRFA